MSDESLLECVEAQPAVGAEDNQLAVESDTVWQLPGGGGDDVGEPVADVVPVAGPQPRPVTGSDDRDLAS